MRTKLHKIMAISITVTMLVSLMIGGFVSPAAAQPPADPLEWGDVDFGPPAAKGDYFYNPANTALGPMEKAIDGTIWLAGYDGSFHLFKSEDFGRTWEETDWEGGEITAIECSSNDADIVYVAEIDNTVQKTEDGGDDWDPVGNPADIAGSATITALSVAYKSDGDPHLYAATAGGSMDGDVYLLAENSDFAEWTSTELLDSTSLAWYAADVWDVEAVYEGNKRFVAIVASADDAGDDDVADGTFCTYKYGTAEWGAEEGAEKAELLYDDTTVLTNVTGAAIWLPESFDSDPDENLFFFVGITADSAAEGDVYKVIAENAFDKDIAGSSTAINVIDLDGAGDDLMVALGYDYTDSDNYVVYNTDDGGNDWKDQDEAPTGDDPDVGYGAVVVADDFSDTGECLFATVGAECAVSLSTDMGETCNQISQIATDNGGGTVNYALDGDTTYLAVVSSGGITSIYRKDGSWERVAMPGSLTDPVVLSVSPDGDAVFYLDLDNDVAYRSTDGGTYFKEMATAPAGGAHVYSMAPVSKNQVFVGGSSAVYYTKNSGDTWKTYDEGLGTGGVWQLTLSPDYDADETLLAVVGDALYQSTDAGKEWSDVKGFTGDGVSCAAFHPDFADNGAIFAAGWEDDTSGGLCVNILGGPAIEADITPDGYDGTDNWAQGIGLGADGTLYVTTYDDMGMLRVLDPLRDDPDEVVDEWQQIVEEFDDGGYFVDYDKYSTLTVVSDGGSNIVYGLAFLNPDPPPPPMAPYGLKRYEDILTGPVVQTSPSDGSSTDKTDRATLAWQDMDGARAYEVQLDIDPEFNGIPDTFDSEPTSLLVTGLDDGQTYYWRVRVIENTGKEDMFSSWSETWAFTTKLGAGEWNPFVGGVPEAPSNGATNVTLTPTFAWNAADWATGYEFVLAKDAAFTDVVISKTGANALATTVFLCDQSLDYSTTYYWKVRGKSNTSASEWATAVFTTVGEAGEAPTAPPTPTPTPPAETPVYIWVIIGIGAALVIAVIVLIVRTRRIA